MEEKQEKRFNKIIGYVLGILALGCLMPVVGNAASLYQSPASGTYEVGQEFTVGVYISSTDEAMNAAVGAINFSNTNLEVLSISKGSTVVNFWVKEPNFSNESGTISFEGVILNPGYVGSAGNLININFKAKAEGKANLTYSSGSILANDGLGTEIGTGYSSASYEIKKKETGGHDNNNVPISNEPLVVDVDDYKPARPYISDEKYSDPEWWFTEKNHTLDWGIPAGTSGVSFLLDQNPYTDPGNTSNGMISSQTFEDLEDGVYYFHIKFQNEFGWGKVGHYRINIDTKGPDDIEIRQTQNGEEIEIETEDGEKMAKIIDGLGFYIEAKDETSGIKEYQVKINDEEFKIWEDDGSHIFQPGILPPGKHTITVKAIDKSGNELIKKYEFEIKALAAPIITHYPTGIYPGDPLVLMGTTLPNSMVTIFVQYKDQKPTEYAVYSDKDGNFTWVFAEMIEGKGDYKIWARAINDKGEITEDSIKYAFEIKEEPAMTIGSWDLNKKSLVCLLSMMVLLLFIIIFHPWKWWFLIFGKKKRKKKEKVDKRQQKNKIGSRNKKTTKKVDKKKTVKGVKNSNK